MGTGRQTVYNKKIGYRGRGAGRMKNCKSLFFIGIFVFSVVVYGANAYAQCVPGLPCIVGKTTNSPSDPSDGPNAPGAPNFNKLEHSQCVSGQPCGACDADFMNQIYARSFLESTRENIMNEVIIRKPDSVMEYTCFDQLVKGVGRDAAPLFSESTRWRNNMVSMDGGAFGSPMIGLVPVPFAQMSTFLDRNRLRDALQRNVLDGLARWINGNGGTPGNFSHTFMGGVMTSNYAPGTADYDCSYLNRVYTFAKCNDINLDDPFLRFEDLINLDPRQLPEACTGGTKITQQLIDVSKNKEFRFVNFDKDEETYRDRFYPARAQPWNEECADPLPTGLTVLFKTKSADFLGNVTTSSVDPYPDKICINPSCSYDRNADRCIP